MLRLMHVHELSQLLLKLPELVATQERDSLSFVTGVRGWLKSVENALAANRLSQTGRVSAIRSKFVAAEQGSLPTDIQVRGRPTRFKVVKAVASQSIQQTSEIVSHILAEIRPRHLEAERGAQQILAAAVAVLGVAALTDNSIGQSGVPNLRALLATRSELRGPLAAIDALVGPQDAAIFLDHAWRSFRSAESTSRSVRGDTQTPSHQGTPEIP